MGCKECGKPKCNGECGCKSPKVLQINNPAEYITFHKVSIPAAMGDSTTNPPKIGAYRNALVYYEADHTSWMYSTDGIPTKLTNGLTDYNEAVNLPQINGHTLIGNQSSSDLGLQGELTAGANIQINGNTISATNTTYTAGNGIELGGTEIKAKIGDGLEFDNNGEIDIADIEQYAHFFDTVADMQASTNLIAGSYAHTLGYHSLNDGGGALYKIRTITNEDVVDESFILSMNDENLVAELVYTDNVNTKQLGVIGLADATTKVQSLIDKSIADGFVLEFGNQEINITSIDFKTAKLTFDKTVFKAIGDSTDVAINISNPAKNACYSGFMVDGNFGVGVEISNSRNLELSSIVVKNCITGVRCLSGYGVRFHNSQIENNADKVDGVGLDIYLDDSAFADIVIQGFRTGLKTSSWCIGNMYERIHVWSIIADTVKNSVGFDVYDTINLRDCVIDTCKTGIKVNRNGRINIQACRWYWNTEYYDDTILEGDPTQLFYFADATVTANVVVRDCYCFKPVGTSVLRFSNLNEADWKSTCDVKNSNPNLSGVSKKPYGYITAFTTPESLTDNINKIVSTESAVTIDYVGKIANDATIGDLNIGTLEANCRSEYSMNAYCVYGAQWDNPDGVAYLYVNSGGAVAIKISSAMLGKYVKVHYVIPR